MRARVLGTRDVRRAAARPTGPTEAELRVGNAHDLACFRRVEKEGFAEDEHEDEGERAMIDAVFADIRSGS